MRRRAFISKMGATTGGMALLAGCSQSGDGSSGSEYPSEEISMVVPYSTGGGFDAYARISAPYWEEHLDGTVVVENVTGGGGTVAGSQVHNADPDGHEFMIWDTIQPVLPQVGRDVNYDIREMSHIGSITRDPNCLIASESAGIEGWDDFINRIDEFNFGTSGIGASYHMYPILLGELSGAYDPDDLNFVHYGGTGEIIGGLQRGEVDVAMPGTTTSGVAFVDSTESELLTVFSDSDRIKEFLDTEGYSTQYFASDLDVENLELFSDITMLNRIFTGPPDVPEDVLSAQRDAFDALINDDEFLDEAVERGRPVVDPADATSIDESISQIWDQLNQDPIKSIIQDSF